MDINYSNLRWKLLGEEKTLFHEEQNSVLDLARNFLKLSQLLKSQVEYESVELSFRDVIDHFHEVSRRFSLDEQVSRTLSDACRIYRLEMYSQLELTELESVLCLHVDEFKDHFCRCIASLDHLQEKPDMPVVHSWKGMTDSIVVVVFILRSLLVTCCECRNRLVRSKLLPLIIEVCGFFATVSGSFNADDSSEMDTNDPFFDLSHRKCLFPIEGESVILELCSEIEAIPLSEKHAACLEIKSFSSRIENSALNLNDLRSGSGSSDNSAEAISTSAFAARNAIQVGCCHLAYAAFSIVGDVFDFVFSDFEYEENLSWNCFGSKWLDAVLRISKTIADEFELLVALIDSFDAPDVILKHLNYLRVNIKALVDVANAHDQFQESSIITKSETFKTGHHWSHRMSRKISSLVESVSMQLQNVES